MTGLTKVEGSEVEGRETENHLLGAPSAGGAVKKAKRRNMKAMAGNWRCRTAGFMVLVGKSMT